VAYLGGAFGDAGVYSGIFFINIRRVALFVLWRFVKEAATKTATKI